VSSPLPRSTQFEKWVTWPRQRSFVA